MKNLTIIFFLLGCAIFNNLHSQMVFKIGLQPEITIPASDLVSGYKTGYGTTINTETNILQNLLIGINFGYTRFQAKDYFLGDINITQNTHWNLWAFGGGLKYAFGNKKIQPFVGLDLATCYTYAVAKYPNEDITVVARRWNPKIAATAGINISITENLAIPCAFKYQYLVSYSGTVSFLTFQTGIVYSWKS